MEITTQPQQLSLSFEASAEEVSASSAVVAQQPLASVAVVYDFKSSVAKREASTHAVLYRQILDSVRHIG